MLMQKPATTFSGAICAAGSSRRMELVTPIAIGTSSHNNPRVRQYGQATRLGDGKTLFAEEEIGDYRAVGAEADRTRNRRVFVQRQVRAVP